MAPLKSSAARDRSAALPSSLSELPGSEPREQPERPALPQAVAVKPRDSKRTTVRAPIPLTSRTPGIGEAGDLLGGGFGRLLLLFGEVAFEHLHVGTVEDQDHAVVDIDALVKGPAVAE